MHVVQIEAAQKLHYAEVRKRLWIGHPKPAPKKVRDIIRIDTSDPSSNASEVAQSRLSHLENRMAEMSKAMSSLSWQTGSILDSMDQEHEDDCKPLSRIAAERWKDILRETAEKHDMTVTTMLANRRARKIVHARQEACYRLVNELGLSYPATARRVNYLDHTTVIHAVQSHAKRNGLPLNGQRPSLDEIRERNAAIVRGSMVGRSVEELADKYDLSVKRVYTILRESRRDGEDMDQ